MEDAQFERRLKCAVSAGWWTALIGILWLVVGWLWWLVVLSVPAVQRFARWAWAVDDFNEMKGVVFLFFAAFKLILFVWILVVICLTIWHKKLSKA